jgi:transposase-like protein
VALAKELGISRWLLYTWREKLEPVERREGPPANSRETIFRKEVSRLKRVLAEKVLEVDFFTGALHTVEARFQRSGKTGAQASAPTSGT